MRSNLQTKQERVQEQQATSRKIFGCIPHEIHGDFGFICKPLSCIKYYLNPIVMIIAVVIIWGFVIWCIVDTQRASNVMEEAQTSVVYYFGWFYVIAMILFGAFSMYLCCSKYGNIKLGPNDEPPKYTLMTWFSMLFSAGIGTGLYYFGVAEPVWHLDDMQEGSNKWYYLTTNQQAAQALNLSWFGWGFAPSATYVVAALPLAYHYHVKNESLRESVCFIALIGEKYANGIIGCLIDLSSVIGTMFGVATSLGIGVLALNGGLSYLFGIGQNLTVQLLIIAFVTLFATISVLTGLDRGIRRLSEINFSFSSIVLLFLFFALDPFYLINLFIQVLGYHFQWLIQLTFDIQAFEQCGFYDEIESNDAQISWMSRYTIFYWAWWISWAPFVGIFIAQISRGRTIREFVIGNMMVPTLLVYIWLTIFGGIGLYNELGSIQNDINCDGDELSWYSEWNGHKIVKLSCFNTAQDMLFATYNTLPLAKVIAGLSMIGITTYFVTSSDSASHVIDILTAAGNTEPPKLQRIFWALSEGVVASVLLATAQGKTTSLVAVQSALLIAAVPFTLVLLFEMMATYKILLIHTGQLNMDDKIYWMHDLFSICSNFGNIIRAILCPPYYQMNARLKIIEQYEQLKRDKNDDDDDEMQEFLRRNHGFEDNATKYVWICGYWILWGLSIIFLLMELFVLKGFYEMGLAFYCFYIVLSVMNRGLIKQFYGINSSRLIFDICSWLFCCFCAVVQEDLQAQDSGDNVKSSKKLKVKNKFYDGIQVTDYDIDEF